MPATAVGYSLGSSARPNDLKMSPSGKLLAVAGLNGLQVFHFNAAGPVTHYTGLLATKNVLQCFWDNDNHLYAIESPLSPTGSLTSGKLYVFTITPTSYSQAPGSPYTIFSPSSLAVLSKH